MTAAAPFAAPAPASRLDVHVGELLRGQNYGRVLAESIVIGAWVARWRPLEIFLYDGWPIRADARLFDRLAAMSVDVVPAPGAAGVAP